LHNHSSIKHSTPDLTPATSTGADDGLAYARSCRRLIRRQIGYARAGLRRPKKMSVFCRPRPTALVAVCHEGIWRRAAQRLPARRSDAPRRHAQRAGLPNGAPHAGWPGADDGSQPVRSGAAGTENSARLGTAGRNSRATWLFSSRPRDTRRLVAIHRWPWRTRLLAIAAK